VNRLQVKAWRKAHGLSQPQLARLLGVSVSAIMRWEAGERDVPPYLHLALRGLEPQLKEVSA